MKVGEKSWEKEETDLASFSWGHSGWLHPWLTGPAPLKRILLTVSFQIPIMLSPLTHPGPGVVKAPQSDISPIACTIPFGVPIPFVNSSLFI